MKRMQETNLLRMENPVKAFFSTVVGMIVGFQTLLTNPDQALTLGIALMKAFAVGGFAWLGQSVAQYGKKRAVRWWDSKHKK